ncbi:hypothetical protein VTL71DRAFT_13375 [Oculimacula yallundae]|uniref:Uncharacterized protein n=1 Tax=Oculimacula yallundae TaxID=86028 RepID=A0ABR4CKR1_9HELO
MGSVSVDEVEIFDPAIHLNYSPPAHLFSLADLQLEQRPSSTPIAATPAFSFLSHEGVLAYRRALFSDEVLKTCSVTTGSNALILRNAGGHSKFLHDLWNHPETLRIMSENMKAPLIPIFQLEEGFVSVQTESCDIDEMKREISQVPQHVRIPLTKEQENFDPLNSNILPWHYDSYPYACIVMLSHTEGMVGGETYIKRGDKKIEKVEGPSYGCAYIIQGGILEHLASRAIGVKERIASVTSFRAAVPGMYDVSYLTNTRPVTDLKIMYREWATYRLQVLESEIKDMRAKIDKDGEVDLNEFSTFAANQVEYTQRTQRQMVTNVYTKSCIERHGFMEYLNAGPIWDRISNHLDFTQKLSEADPDIDWKVARDYVGDLAMSKNALRHGEILQGQLGPVSWSWEREYVMGDELLRQGQREIFFEWVEKTGLWALKS